jgi:hypothetical protein
MIGAILSVSAHRMKLGPVAARVQGMSRTAFVGDQMTHGGQKGFGMTKHGRSGHATRSPRFRFLQKLEVGPFLLNPLKPPRRFWRGL